MEAHGTAGPGSVCGRRRRDRIVESRILLRAGQAMTRVLVTGAAGFIGSHVADQCLRVGFDVTAVDNLSGGFVRNVPPDARFIEGDLCDAAFVDSLWAG